MTQLLHFSDNSSFPLANILLVTHTNENIVEVKGQVCIVIAFFSFESL